MRPILAALLVVLSVSPAAADRVTLGWGRLFTNDLIGDGQDRWRTGSYVVSFVRGNRFWNGQLPKRPGDILEYRFHTQIITPSNLQSPGANDRRFVGAWSMGVHTHFQSGPFETSAGVDLVATGPMTRLDDFQSGLHDLAGVPVPNPSVYANQIPNGWHPTATVEAGHTFRFGDSFSARPFIEASAGVENYVRIGGDLLFGATAQSDLMLRDVTSGHRYRATGGGVEGFSFALGGDVAKVWDSVYLPASDGYALTDARVRLRAGVHWQGKNSALFYGLTWLGREFEAQPEGQLVGSLRLKIFF